MLKKASLWLHLVGAISFLLIPVLIAPQPMGHSRFELDPPTLRDLIGNAMMLAFFYANFYFLIPGLFERRKFVSYFLIVFCSFVAIIALPELLHYQDPPPPAPHHFPARQTPPPASGRNILDFLGSVNHQVLLFLVVGLFSILLRIRERLYDAETAQSHAEIESLRSQINPHFLFNTLNAIFGLSIREKAEKTGQSILKLSDLLRYIVAHTGKDKVKLGEEIASLQDFVALQRLRLNEDVDIEFDVTVQDPEKEIVPLILMPFVENAFKHGVSPDEPSEIKIHMRCMGNLLDFRVSNRLVKVDLQTYEKSGIGLGNTQSRLQLLYPNAHQLTINQTEEFFLVHLSLQL